MNTTSHMSSGDPSFICPPSASLRKLALKSMDPPNACERLLLARNYNVDDWVLPALSALCERRLPVSLEEARPMDNEDVVLVATVREEIRDNKLPVNMAGISRRIKRCTG